MHSFTGSTDAILPHFSWHQGRASYLMSAGSDSGDWLGPSGPFLSLSVKVRLTWLFLEPVSGLVGGVHKPSRLTCT